MSTGPKPRRFNLGLPKRKAKGWRKHVREKAWRERQAKEKKGLQ